MTRIDLYSKMSVRDVRDHFIELLPGDGATVLGSDYEGFEAEVYFQLDDFTGMVHVVSACSGGTLAALRLYEQS